MARKAKPSVVPRWCITDGPQGIWPLGWQTIEEIRRNAGITHSECCERAAEAYRNGELQARSQDQGLGFVLPVLRWVGKQRTLELEE